MEDIVKTALSWLGDVLGFCFDKLASFFLSFFPDADAGVVSTINSWGSGLSGYDMTFNVFYFVDMGIVGVFIGMAALVFVASLLYWLAQRALDVISKLVDMIPIVE